MKKFSFFVIAAVVCSSAAQRRAQASPPLDAGVVVAPVPASEAVDASAPFVAPSEDAMAPEQAPSADAGAASVDAALPARAVESSPAFDAGAQVALNGAPDAAHAEPSPYAARAEVERPAGPGEFEPYGTGSRMNIPLAELPASVALVDKETMRERGVVDLTQALGLISGVMPTWQYGGFLNIRVRGFQALTLYDGRRDARALVADSAPQAGLYDLERIELLRGPSSVLYGYGAVGGAVNLIRRRPSRDAAYEFELGLGLPLQGRAHVGAQGPLGSMFSYRVDLGHVTRTDFRGARTERSQVASAVRFAPNRRHALNVRLAYSFDRYTTDVGIPTSENPERPGTWALPPYARRSNFYGTKNDHLGYQRLEIAADYRAQLNKRTHLDARGAVTRDQYDYLAAEELNYVAGTGDSPAQVERSDLYFARGWTPMLGQLELHSQQKTGPISHRVMIGYQLDRFGGVSDRGDTGLALTCPGAEEGSDPSRVCPVDYAYPQDRTPKAGRLQRTGQDHYRQLTHALYAFDHIKLLKQLILTGGARFDAYRNNTRRHFIDRETGEEIPDPATGTYRPRNSQENKAVTGQVGVVYSPLTQLTGYAGYASAFMPKIVFPGDVMPVKYSPERGQQFEGGLRVHMLKAEHLLTLDAAGYYIEKTNVVIPRGVDMFSQAGKIASRGLDLTLHYRAPAYVQLDGGYSLTDAKYKEYVTTDPVSGENVSRNGNQVDFAPRHSGNAWLRLFANKHIGAGIGGRFMGKQYADPENRLPLPRYALLDASLWFGGDHATFTVSANNLLDEHAYYTSAINTWAVNPQVTPGPGREILGTLRLTL
jgi:iron complex outermembrane recepter protein